MKRKRLLVVALGAGALLGLGVARRAKAAREPVTSPIDTTSAGDDSVDVVDVESEHIDDDGNLVVDDLLVAVSSDGKIVAADETVAVITPDGDAVVDETLSVVGDDGDLHAVEEDIAVTEADE